MKNVNLIVGMIGGILTVIWTIVVFVGGLIAGAGITEKFHKNENLKVVK